MSNQSEAIREEEERRKAWERSLKQESVEDYARPDVISIGLMLALIVVFGVVAVVA